uniref:DUF4806 domain-containing protein n=1 Tax=Schizaphis graminum TaxID=13262 RepID=A0A2S2PT21_SCHGA
MANYQNIFTHLVIKFDEKNKQGKDIIDLVPISWTHDKDGQIYCKYPNKNEYHKINKMCKKSMICDPSWNDFKITVVKEAHSYEQGLRRMEKAFSDTVVQSSVEELVNSSEEEEGPQQFNKNDLKACLNDISEFGGSKINFMPESFDDDYNNSSQSEVYNSEELSNSDNCNSSSSSYSNEKRFFKKPKKKCQTSIIPPKKVAKHDIQKKSKIRQPEHYIVQPTTSNTIVTGKKIHNIQSKYCPTCGAAATESVTQANLESAKRSILYSIREEAKATRTLIATNSNTNLIEKIMQEENIVGLPALDLESFLDFEKQLKNDIELIKKIKCFMAINIKCSVKLSDNMTVVIPQIMSKSVQVMYSAFGRETNGIKKLNFSATETYKHLLEALTSKFSDLKHKEIASQLSRWFSGAKDREGGKKERLYKKIKMSETT